MQNNNDCSDDTRVVKVHIQLPLLANLPTTTDWQLIWSSEILPPGTIKPGTTLTRTGRVPFGSLGGVGGEGPVILCILQPLGGDESDIEAG